ncbi:MAG: rod shape-determining protein [Butyribacter sp.]|nr:rod shape-determining protein [bacterium]MDY3853501.1 rod shape-determining protein [Butyribacter sp.]
MAKKIFGIDFGTNAIKVYKKGDGILLMERTAVSTVGKEKKPIAIGEKAYEMYEKAPPSIHVSLPINRGVVSHLDDMVALWNFMGQKISGKKKMNHCQFYIAVPADITEVEKNAYSKIITKSDSKPQKVCLIDKPIADAYGLGLDVEKSRGILIVNLGADTTEISVLSLGGIVVSKLIPYGGNDFDRSIQNYIRKEYNFIIGLKTAENLKKQLVSTTRSKQSVSVVGRNVMKGLPDELEISANEIFPLTQDIFYGIAAEIKSILERTPPEISTEILHNGIFLTGGTSFVDGLDQFLANQVNVRVNTTKNAQKTVISGIGYLAEHSKLTGKYAVPLL